MKETLIISNNTIVNFLNFKLKIFPGIKMRNFIDMFPMSERNRLGDLNYAFDVILESDAKIIKFLRTLCKGSNRAYDFINCMQQ